MEYITGCIRSVEVDHENNTNMTAIARLPQAPRSLEIPLDSDHPVSVMMDEKGSLLRCNYRSGYLNTARKRTAPYFVVSPQRMARSKVKLS